MAVAEKDEAQTEEESFQFKRFLGDLMDIAESIFASIFVITMMFAYLLRPVTVDGSSMFPTLYDKDRLIMWSLGYEPTPGDIIIIDDAESGHFTDASQTEVVRSEGLNMRLVKRCIAVSGQTVNINFETGEVTRDGEVLDEPYISAATTRNDMAFQYPMTVPEGYIFVMGDNRPASTDSRNPSVALVPEEQVIGRAVWRFFRDEEECQSWTDRFAILLNK